MKKPLLLLLSWFIVAFGQPSLIPFLGLFAAFFGYIPLLYVLSTTESWKSRFWIGTLWYGGVQLVQLFWSLGHPYNYIYIVYLVAAFLLGLQFAIFALFVTKKRISSWPSLLALCGLFVLLEWMRLFFLSGHPWNPAGLALASTTVTLQFASLTGVYGLSFLVLFVNLSFLKKSYVVATCALLLPLLFGFWQIENHKKGILEAPRERIALVQTNFPIEEILSLDAKKFNRFVVEEWRQIITLLKPLQGQKVDLVVLPELVVPYGTFYLMYDYEEVKRIFRDTFDELSLPPLSPYLSREIDGRIRVNNAFWIQAIADTLQTNVVVGLEDVDFVAGEEPKNYTAAYLVRPEERSMQRYEKQILVPMGEYIPFSFLRELAANYGISGSFTPGKEAKLLYTDHLPLGVSICYEEIMGDLMRKSKEKGAHLLLNLTNDAWYPHYGLPRAHLEHGRLRTVEMGIALARACNTGVTCAIDSLGRDIARLGSTQEEEENLQGVLVVEVPIYSYSTLYTRYGDLPIILFSLLLLPFIARNRKFPYH